ncbi:MAG: T9SS type A sorting domain-containing protein [Sphingobacteriales bacterium]|nr:MAG: T9SS type A sorting domain-containing protein [Sphingobacteriales bacterium]
MSYPKVTIKDLKTTNRLWGAAQSRQPIYKHRHTAFPYRISNHLYLFNTQGKIVQQLVISHSEYTVGLSTHHLPNGVYFLSLIADGIRIEYTKFVIQH